MTTQTLTHAQQAWLAALEDGDFAQDGGFLQTEDGFCCLGVACVVYEHDTGERLRRGDDGTLRSSTLAEYPQVQRWLGLRGSGGECLDNSRETLAGLNDDGVPFAEIALHVREHPDAYLKQEDEA